MVPRFMEIHFSKRRWKLGHKMLKTAAQKKLFFTLARKQDNFFFLFFFSLIFMITVVSFNSRFISGSFKETKSMALRLRQNVQSINHMGKGNGCLHYGAKLCYPNFFQSELFIRPNLGISGKQIILI